MRLTFNDVGRRFGTTWAIRDLTAAIEPGQMLALLGANGAGKTTLLRLIAGWLPVSMGRITLGERLLKPSRVSARRNVMLLDEPITHDGKAIEVILSSIADYQIDRVDIEDEVAAWIDRLELTPSSLKSARSLSKGQLYKMSMIALFVVNPAVWLLDEPFSCGLDAEGLQCLEDQMREHVSHGGLVIFSSQWPEHARRLAGHAWVLSEHTLVWDHAIGTAVDDTIIEAASPSLRAVLRGLA